METPRQISAGIKTFWVEFWAQHVDPLVVSQQLLGHAHVPQQEMVGAPEP